MTVDTAPSVCWEVAAVNFAAEVKGLASFYEGRIPLHWQDKLSELADLVEEGGSDGAAD